MYMQRTGQAYPASSTAASQAGSPLRRYVLHRIPYAGISANMTELTRHSAASQIHATET